MVDVNNTTQQEENTILEIVEILFENILPCPIDDHQTIGVIKK